MTIRMIELPKVDLHLHLDGCVKPGTLWELARLPGSPPLPGGVTAPQELVPYMTVDESNQSLTQYLSKFDTVLPFLQTGEALERVAYEAVEQASAHGCLYIEVRFGPSLHMKQGLTQEDAIHHVVAGLMRGEAAFGVKARVIACCMRHHDEDRNGRVVEAAVAWHGRGVVALDLAGDEAGFPPALFEGLFAAANDAGLPATVHAGEAAGPDSIRDAIDKLGAARIGHGVRLEQDAELFELVRERGIPLEMCPVSNLQTKASIGWEVYPLRRYMEKGLLVTVNTDNPTVSGTTMTKEYEELAAHLGFTYAELAQLSLNGVEAAFLPAEEKAALRAVMLERLVRIGLAP